MREALSFLINLLVAVLYAYCILRFREEDSALELSSLLSLGIMGLGNSRDQVETLNCL